MFKAGVSRPREYVMQKGQLPYATHSLEEGVGDDQILELGNIDAPVKVITDSTHEVEGHQQLLLGECQTWPIHA